MEVKVFKVKEIKVVSGDGLNVKECCMVEGIVGSYGKEGDGCMDIYGIWYEYDVDKDRFIYDRGLGFNIGNDGNGEGNEMCLGGRSKVSKCDFYMGNGGGSVDWGYGGEVVIIFKNGSCRDLVDGVCSVGEIVDKLRGDMDLGDSMVGNGRVKVNNVRSRMSKIVGKVCSGGYNCDGKDRCCELIINSGERISWKEVECIEELGESEGGKKGFGEGRGGGGKG